MMMMMMMIAKGHQHSAQLEEE